MKKSTLLLTSCIAAGLMACGGEKQTQENEKVEAPQEMITETVEEVIEEAPAELSLADKIMGKWQQTHQGCDEEGNNGEEMSKDTFWNFDGTNVTWSSFTHPYRIENDQILIGEGEGSPYAVIKEDGDMIVLKAIKRDRNMRLIKVAAE